MADLTAAITPAQKYDLSVTFVDAASNPAPTPGPVVWTIMDASFGALAPTPDTLGCRFTPTPNKPGMAKIFGVDPSAPSIPSVEADITISPLATKMLLTGKVVS